MVCVVVAFLGMHECVAQDPNFSQFYNNPVYYNPSLVAINGGYTFRAHARNLWAPIPGKFNTFAASFEAEVIPKLGFAFNAYTDVAGEGLLRTTGGYLTYGYRVVETKNFLLQFGATGGIINKNIDWSRLKFSDQYDEVLGEVHGSQFVAPNYNSILYPDFGSGLTVRFNHESKKVSAYKKMMVTAGFAAHHLTRPADAFIADKQFLPIKWVGHLNTAVLVNESILTPSFIYERQREFQTFTIGLSMVKKPLIVGLWMRNETYYFNPQSFDSFILTVGTSLPLKNDQNIRMTYSVDFTVSQLRLSSFGSHELSLVYELDNRYMLKSYHSRKNRMRRYQCPKDFMGYE